MEREELSELRRSLERLAMRAEAQEEAERLLAAWDMLAEENERLRAETIRLRALLQKQAAASMSTRLRDALRE